MKMLLPLAILLITLFAQNNFAQNKPVKKPNSETPLTQAYKNLYVAVKNKNMDAIKQNLSKETIKFCEKFAEIKKMSLVEYYSGLTDTSSRKLPRMKNERIQDNFGILEVKNKKGKRWDGLPFIFEDGKWKLAFGEVWIGTFKMS